MQQAKMQYLRQTTKTIVLNDPRPKRNYTTDRQTENNQRRQTQMKNQNTNNAAPRS